MKYYWIYYDAIMQTYSPYHGYEKPKEAVSSLFFTRKKAEKELQKRLEKIDFQGGLEGDKDS